MVIDLTTAECLALSAAIFAAAWLLQRAPVAGHGSSRVKVAIASLLCGVGLSISSYLVQRTGASGTGVRVQSGWPKSFHTSWRSWEDGTVSSELSTLFFAANTLVHTAVVLLILVIARRWWLRGT